ncbi:transcriptional regulator [Amycolatopsis antarctica]|uniref:Transcriptional regulator n=1 Tax=Amycolatopsis antarctica TaxID=1854586 RepID=A0A263DB24_9PSEU|nr:helix-turn-helix transcriptional regulator [Amycolatopsis antarctica]OZM75188.1 transcriptional regulator [Amycolatopsis antarctica]
MPDWWSPALWDAARRGDHATVLRLAREEQGWSQGQLGDRFGCSASTISRFENSRRGLRDVAVLRRFAAILELPAEAFGLTGAQQQRPASPAWTAPASKVSIDLSQEGDDPVRRRAFLLAAGGIVAAGTAVASPNALAADRLEVDPAAFLAQRLDGVLLGTTAGSARPAPISTLQSVLTTARADFRACRYVDLAARLPELITTAEATHQQTGDPAAAGMVAQAYNLATRALVKLEASGLEWVSADRALRAVTGADDPLALAEAQRLLGSACRRAGQHDRAQTLTLTAADQLDLGGNTPDPRHLALHGVLMCSAGYAAARAGDHDRATDLLDDANATAGRLADHPAQQQALTANVVSHRVSSDYVLGNAGAGLYHAQAAQLGQFPDTERRARFLVDVALCFSQWNKPGRAYRTLLTAERTAPGEVRTRATVRRLVTDLLHHPQQASLPGLRQLAARTHALV